MDTPYLEQLKLSSERLQDIIPAVNPFATYTMGAETAPPSIQGVPQNYFDPMTGQFMMPDLQLGETTSTDGSIPASFGTYTPAPFGESATNEVIPGLMSNPMTGGQGGGDVGGIFGGIQGQNDPNNPSNLQDSYTLNANGTITQYDASTGLTKPYGLDDENLSLAQKLFGFATTVPTTASVIEKMLGGLLGGGINQGLQAGYNMNELDDARERFRSNPTGSTTSSNQGNNQGVAGGGNNDAGSAGGSVNTGGGGFGGIHG